MTGAQAEASGTDIQERNRRIVPLSWQAICESVSNQHYHRLGRASFVEEQYQEERCRTLNKYVESYDFLYEIVFGIETILDQSSGKLMAATKPSPNDVRLRLSDYPYLVETGIHHYVLWAGSQESLKNALDGTNIRLLLPPDVRECPIVHFINPVHLQSVPGIAHAHIFIKYSLTQE